jgi:hypothetical protein
MRFLISAFFHGLEILNFVSQVSTSNGSVTGNWHVVTDDGCGPLQALVDSTASSKWSQATEADVTTTMPGTAGNCVSLDSGDDDKAEAENESTTSRVRRALVKMGLMTKRAQNVNKSFVSTTLY